MQDSKHALINQSTSTCLSLNVHFLTTINTKPNLYCVDSPWWVDVNQALHLHVKQVPTNRQLNLIHFQWFVDLKSSNVSMLTHICIQHPHVCTYMCTCWKIRFEIYIWIQRSKLLMVGLISTQKCTTSTTKLRKTH
jgi:hypothetical protein